MDNLRKLSTHEHEAIASSISKQSQYTGREISRINAQSSLLVRKAESFDSDFNGFRSQTENMFAHTHHSIDTVATEVQDIHTQTTSIASSIDATTKIVRQELCTTMKPIIEQAFTTMNNHTDARMQRVEDLIQRIVHDIGNNSQQPIDSNITGGKLRRSSEGFGGGQSVDIKSMNQCGINSATTRATPDQQDPNIHYSVATYRRRWYQQWRIGSIEIEVLHAFRRKNGLPLSDSIVVINIHFRPSQAILRLPGVSILYNTGPNYQGYYQLAPMIAALPILEFGHPVYQVIQHGDLRQLQQLLADGEVHIRSENQEGSTLLHVSVGPHPYTLTSRLSMFSGSPYVALRVNGMLGRIQPISFANQDKVCCPHWPR